MPPRGERGVVPMQGAQLLEPLLGVVVRIALHAGLHLGARAGGEDAADRHDADREHDQGDEDLDQRDPTFARAAAILVTGAHGIPHWASTRPEAMTLTVSRSPLLSCRMISPKELMRPSGPEIITELVPAPQK